MAQCANWKLKRARTRNKETLLATSQATSAYSYLGSVVESAIKECWAEGEVETRTGARERCGASQI